MYLVWKHATDIFYVDQECGLYILPKLSYKHVKLTIMNAKLAAQVIIIIIPRILLIILINTRIKLSDSGRPWIKSPRIVNCDKFPEIRGDDCDCFRVIRGKCFFFNEYFFVYYFF